MTDNDAQAARGRPPAPGVGRGQAIREARVRRVRQIRRRVIGGAVGLFVATWLLIAIVLVSGHDPALARKTPAVAGASSTGTTTSAGSGSSTAATTSGNSGTTTSAGGTTSSVTTRQS
jgi:hypothetical protein